MSQDNLEIKFKISFIGDIGAGKTSLIYRATDTPQPKPFVTIGLDFLIKRYQINGIRAKVFFWDSVGGDIFRSPTLNHLYRNAHAICLCFSLEDSRNFEYLSQRVVHLKNYSQDSKLYLIGCKSDIACEISKQQIQRFAQDNNLTYLQTSAKQNIGVHEGFHKVVNEIFASHCGQGKQELTSLVSKNTRKYQSCC